jgi:carboxyl-terminal processing protease
MRHLAKPAVAVAALLGAFYLSISVQYGDPGWRLEFNKSARARSEAPGPEYDLRTLQVLNRAVILIKENYVDPDRVNERKMIGGAMEEVQKAVAELLVEIARDKDDVPTRITVQVGGQRRAFDLADVDNLWQMSFLFNDLFSFIQTHLEDRENLRDVEYAAINGMLATLDPHSVLLRPEDYREMKLSTRGKFGGLGIVISVRDGHLTIINPIADTPAARTGLKAGDRIVQIDLDSTINMDLSDAVEMLRGPPHTKVTIHILREGWTKPRPFTLTRDNIKVRSVDSRRLDNDIGLVRLRNFQNTTSDELKEALEKLRSRGKRLRGLILDLRDNPGGLLDQAIKVSDLFIESGPIVTTVGVGDKLREPKMATRAGTEDTLPLVVLTSPSSASASEIVAGALKNHRRALLLGQQTFGKGSVQVIYDNKDESALKLTIAQYLTPGDVSIQSVGIAPDILTEAVVLEDEETTFFRPQRGGEGDLPEHLEPAERDKIVEHNTPTHTVRYLSDAAIRKQIEDNPNDLIEDFEISLAKDIISSTRKARADEMLVEAKAAIDRRGVKEEQRIIAALGARGIDWTEGLAAEGTPAAEIAVTADRPENAVDGGETIALTTTVKNVGDGPFGRLRAITESENPWFEGHEQVFGNLKPGESRSWTTKVEVPKSALTRRDPVKFVFAAETGAAPEPVVVKVEQRSLNRPRFAFTFQVDDTGGNGDGLLQPGEEVELVLKVTNVGDGKSHTAVAALRNGSEDEARGIFIKRGRVNLETIDPAGRAEARFSFRVKEDVEQIDVPVQLSVVDMDVQESTAQEFMLRVTPNVQVEANASTLRALAGDAVVLRGAPEPDAPPMTLVRPLARADGRLEGWFRVPTGDGLYGWVPADEVEPREGTATGRSTLSAAIPKGPPVINLAGARPDVETQSDALTLTGEALGKQTIRDLLIFVNNRKVFFQANEGEDDLARARLRFEARVPLEKGVNRITLIAREDEQLSTRETVIVTRN